MTDAPQPQRRVLLVLIALFSLPLTAAFILYYGVGWRPAGNSSHGQLLEPVRALPAGAEPLREKWALIYVGDGRCDTDCRTALVFARQTRLSLNQEMTRVNRALLATDNCCDLAYLDKEHAGIKVFDVSEPGQRGDLLKALPATDLNHSLFVIDPLGNIVMRYDVRNDPHGLLDDMKKLLKLSSIG
jgi:hypothetical protein